jgi:hypothetical protein
MPLILPTLAPRSSDTNIGALQGMEGIEDEYELFARHYPDRPTYALGRPGGAAAKLVERSPDELVSDLMTVAEYPVLLRRIVDDVARRTER